MITTYTKDIPNIDAEILTRISEAEIQMWLVAKLVELRQKGVPIHSISANADFIQNRPFYAHWNMHAAGKCSGMCAEIFQGFSHLRDELLENPLERAKANRRLAQEKLQEAEELEALAKTQVAA